MNKITTFDKPTLKAFRGTLDKYFTEIYNETGIRLEIGNIRFTSNEFHTKLTGVTSSGVTEETQPVLQKGDQEKLAFEMYCHLVGLQKEDYGRTFKSPSGMYTIVGLNLRAPKFPIIAIKIGTTDRYKFPEKYVKDILDKIPQVQ